MALSPYHALRAEEGIRNDALAIRHRRERDDLNGRIATMRTDLAHRHDKERLALRLENDTILEDYRTRALAAKGGR